MKPKQPSTSRLKDRAGAPEPRAVPTSERARTEKAIEDATKQGGTAEEAAGPRAAPGRRRPGGTR